MGSRSRGDGEAVTVYGRLHAHGPAGSRRLHGARGDRLLAEERGIVHLPPVLWRKQRRARELMGLAPARRGHAPKATNPLRQRHCRPWHTGSWATLPTKHRACVPWRLSHCQAWHCAPVHEADMFLRGRDNTPAIVRNEWPWARSRLKGLTVFSTHESIGPF